MIGHYSTPDVDIKAPWEFCRFKTYGRKLQADDGRVDTSAKISEISRCCTLVSCRLTAKCSASALQEGATEVKNSSRWDHYQLRVELGQPRLAGIIEDEHSIDHGGSTARGDFPGDGQRSGIRHVGRALEVYRLPRHERSFDKVLPK